MSLLVLVVGATALTFEDYLAQFGKSYGPQEYTMRQAIFAARLKQIEYHNSKPAVSYQLGVNQFMDKTAEEHQSMLGHRPLKLNRVAAVRKITQVDPKVVIPDSVDWREKGVITKVKDQGHCGSCWAFATTESVESALAIATGKLIELSPQNVVSCTPNFDHCGGQGGCDGATSELGFIYVMNNGIALETDWPYKAVTGTCQERSKAAVTQGLVQLAENNQNILLQQLALVGPIAISVDASPWHLYKSGIFDACPRNATINHAVQLVGYGEENGTKYWLVRNSWGPTWGEKGYIRIKRFNTAREYCGVDSSTESGTACDGYPSNATVCGMCGILYDSSYPIGAELL